MKLKSLTILILSAVILTACASEPEPAPILVEEEVAEVPAGTRADPYEGHGVIQEVQDGQLVIQHDAIPGFMAAMTMGYPVDTEVDVADLAPGDEIMFDIERLEPDGYRIFRVQAIESEQAPQ